MRGAISFIVVMLLAGASLEGQAGPRGSQPAKVVKPEAAHATAPVVDAHVAPAKPVVQTAVQGAAKPAVHVETKTVAQAPAKPAAHAETKAVAPAKPAEHGEAKTVATAAAKPGVQAAAKPGAPATPPAPAKPPTKTLEEAAESIAAALKARGVTPPSRARSESEPAPRAPRIKRYALYWPPDDTKWDVQWPTISGRVALTWDEPSETSHQPASD